MNYEQWRISYQDSEQAARATFTLAAELAAENLELRRIASAIESDPTEPEHRRQWAKQLFAFNAQEQAPDACGRLTEKQPIAVPNDWPAVWDLVMKDMNDRDKMGTRKHGTRLQPHNGRDALVDAYQEALDLVGYLRQAIYERDAQQRNNDWFSRSAKTGGEQVNPRKAIGERHAD